MPGRRSFLIGCGGIVAAPVLALIDLPSAMGKGPGSLSIDVPQQLESTGATPPEDLVLRMNGWDSPSASGPEAHAEIWVHINSSWRSAWR